jgi:diacylglycerol kinase (ATP)
VAAWKVHPGSGMRVTVIHNPTAGEGEPSADALCRELRAAGHETSYASTKGGDWKSAVQDPGDLVLAAGGDGTVAKVARRLVGRSVPLAPLPLGTANNIAGALGVEGGWRALVHGLEDAATRHLDVGTAAGPWGERTFLEGAGFGLIAAAMAAADDEPAPAERETDRERKLRSDVARLLSLLPTCEALPCTIDADERRIGVEALLVAVMNIPTLGPRLALAPGARPDDGRLRIVVAREDDREEIGAHLRARMEGRDAPLRLQVHHARAARVRWPGPLAHVDDELKRGGRGEVDASFRVRPRALRVLLPRG